MLLLKQALLGQTEVRKTRVTILINKHVLWFDITMYNTIPVHFLDGENEFSQVDPGMILVEPPLALLVDYRSHITTWTIIGDHVEVFKGLECIV